MGKKKIGVLGGGTGTFTVLSGLKYFPVELSAVVSIADNGGSTGILRDELGVLPPGDIRQCLVALASGDDILRNLFNYRFHEGSLSGHNFGNLFLSALEKITGDPLSAVRQAHRILQVRGKVIPVSAQASHLFAELEDGTVVEGEHAIDAPSADRSPIRRCFLSPSVAANEEALQIIQGADALIFGPGDFFTSLVPVLLVEGIPQALAQSKGRRIFITNLMTKRGQTDQFSASKFLQTLHEVIAPAKIDTVVINSVPVPQEIVDRYVKAGEDPVKDDLQDVAPDVIRKDLLSRHVTEAIVGDQLRRTLLRHDPEKLAQAIMEVVVRG